MKKNLTELVMILDRSGSMQGLEKDTIGGYNSMLEKQRKTDGEVLLTTVLFDNQIEVLHDRTPLEKVRAITEEEYYVRGCTALLDAVGTTIRNIAMIHKYAREEDRPEKTIFVITTDGMENASSIYRAEQVKEMVRKESEKYGWEFIFLGANIDAVETASHIGIGADRAANFHSDPMGTKLNYEVISETVTAMRKSAAPIGAGWKKKIDKDYKARKK